MDLQALALGRGIELPKKHDILSGEIPDWVNPLSLWAGIALAVLVLGWQDSTTVSAMRWCAMLIVGGRLFLWSQRTTLHGAFVPGGVKALLGTTTLVLVGRHAVQVWPGEVILTHPGRWEFRDNLVGGQQTDLKRRVNEIARVASLDPSACQADRWRQVASTSAVAEDPSPKLIRARVGVAAGLCAAGLLFAETAVFEPVYAARAPHTQSPETPASATTPEPVPVPPLSEEERTRCERSGDQALQGSPESLRSFLDDYPCRGLPQLREQVSHQLRVYCEAYYSNIGIETNSDRLSQWVLRESCMHTDGTVYFRAATDGDSLKAALEAETRALNGRRYHTPNFNLQVRPLVGDDHSNGYVRFTHRSEDQIPATANIVNVSGAHGTFLAEAVQADGTVSDGTQVGYRGY